VRFVDGVDASRVAAISDLRVDDPSGR